VIHLQRLVRIGRLWIVLVYFLGIPVPCSAEPSFRLLPFYARDVSPDGQIVAGSDGRISGGIALLWNVPDQSVIPLKSLGGAEASFVSNNAQFAIGNLRDDGRIGAPVLWANGEPIVLPDPKNCGGLSGSSASDLASNGIAVGTISMLSGEHCVSTAIRWNQGQVSRLPLPAGAGPEADSYARGISNDGMVIAGGVEGVGGVIWTETSTVLPPVGTFNAVSGNGRYFVTGGADACLTLWSEENGTEVIPLTEDVSFCWRAVAVSDDGSTVVGYRHPTNFPSSYVWDRRHGLKTIYQALTDDWGLPEVNLYNDVRASAMSDDGTVMVGVGSSHGEDVYFLASRRRWEVVDPVPLLLEGPRVTSDPERLIFTGRHVVGLAADGVSQVVVRIHPVSGSSQATVTIQDENQAPVASAEDEGAVSPIGSDPLESSLLEMQVDPVSTSRGSAVVFLYRAPRNFVRPSEPADATVGERDVWINVSFSDGRVERIPIRIVRPPLLLIHGTFSDPSVWDGSPLATDSRFVVHRSNYSESIDDRVWWVVPSRTWETVRRNVIGVKFNAPVLLNDLVTFMTDFRTGALGSGPVAAVQADVVAHSLGGLMARGMIRLPRFYSDETYQRGRFHKLITLGTTHLGSHQSLRLLDGTNDCSRSKGIYSGAYNLTEAVIDGVRYNGAVFDQTGDGTLSGASEKIQELHEPLPKLGDGSAPPRVPTAFVAGGWTNDNSSTDVDSQGGKLRVVCSDFMAEHFRVSLWDEIFDGLLNDVIVSVVSAADGQNNFRYFPGVVHGPGSVGTGTLQDPHLGFLGPNLLDQASGVPAYVGVLLNADINDSRFILTP